MSNVIFEATDYSKAASWYMNEFDSPDKMKTQVDVFFFPGTSVMVHDRENGVGNICEQMTESYKALYDAGMSAFDDGTRMYIPYYRQIASDSAIEGRSHEALLDRMKASEVAADIEESLDYYFRHYNQGRPFIIAGQSQGGAAVQIALERYFTQEEHKPLLDRLVAAYSIAYGVDRKWLENVGCIDFAKGATDTGVLISWVTEGPGCHEQDVLLADIPSDTLIINPVNWKTDDTCAKAEESLGALVEGKIVTPGIYNLQINPERGCLVCDNNTGYVETVLSDGSVLWGGKSLHLHEIGQAYLSIRKNMHDRINAFLLKPMDYSNRENWARFEENPEKPVDAIWICGTIAQAADLPNGRAELTPQIRGAMGFMGNRMVKIFEDFTNPYIPFYRQVALDGALDTGGGKGYLDRIESSGTLEDVFDALDYYFENVNNGRPFFLTGHSQGGAIVQKTLEIYMRRHPEYLERMVAAYAVGFSVTKTWLKENPHIRFAEGETDAGVMISWNTEGPGATEPNFTIQPETVLINPINWKLDETPADASENKGSRVNNMEALALSGKPYSMEDIKDEIYSPGTADAKIDLKRGALICTTVTSYIDQAGFGDRSLHTGDWDLYYRNVAENMQKRLETFMKG